MANLFSVFSNLNSQGFFDIVLPWILFLLIFFVIIREAPFLKGKEKSKQISIIIASILALFAVNYIPLGAILSSLFGQTGMIIAGLLVVIILLGLAGVELKELTGGSQMLLGVLILAIAAIAFSGSGYLRLGISDSTLTLLFMAVVVIAAMIFLGGEEGGGEDKKDK